jgi:hypothetical protein
MATKAQQIEILRARLVNYWWDLDNGNKTPAQIHAKLLQDSRELLNTPSEHAQSDYLPNCEVNDITESQQIALDSQGEL